MTTNSKTAIWVYAHWQGIPDPMLVGILSAHDGKGKKTFSFEYAREWLKATNPFVLDPDIHRYTGVQFPTNEKDNFGVFADSMPDSWGRKLMQRRAAQQAREEKRPAKNLYELDYLLGVHDFTRMGGLRFKLQQNGPFLDNDRHQAAPPWATIRELQYSAEIFEADNKKSEKKWLEMLIAPGSSLGGARPKANIVDDNGELWIAKFPSVNDTTDKSAWEYLAHLLAVQSGIGMAECRLESIYGRYRTFFTKRFDRHFDERIHFSSAMTMTGYNEELLKHNSPSYLEIAEFIQKKSSGAVAADLQQLWRRIVFNIAISNTDDHLRNHGFLLTDEGWQLSPAYDLNPSIDKSGLGLNIDMDNNDLDLDLAKSVGAYFKLDRYEMDTIIEEVAEGTANWRELATGLGIPGMEQERMAPAFTLTNDRPRSRSRGR